MTQKEKDIEFILNGLEALGYDLNDVNKVRSVIAAILSHKPLDVSSNESDITFG